MEEDIGVEPNNIRAPYLFRSRVSCPFSPDTIEEGEHHVPHMFQSFSNRMRQSSPVISLRSFQVYLDDSSVESDHYSDDSIVNEENESFNEVSLADQLNFSTLSGEELSSKVFKMYVENPDGMANVLEDLLIEQDTLKLLIIELLEDFYIKHDAPLYHRLRNVYVQGYEAYYRNKDILDLIAQKGKGFLDIQTKQQGINYYRGKLRFLMSKSEGLNSSMF